MKKYLLALIVILFVDSIACATGQIADKIIYKGESYALFTNPLEPYFELHPDKRPETGLMSTALWRGYVATFEIKDHQFLVQDIEIEVWKDKTSHNTEWKSVLAEVFPEEERVHAHWFSGLLVIPKGELLQYVHMGYASEYEKYTVLQISNGMLEKAKDFSHAEYVAFKQRQFQEFQKTEEYQHLFDELRQELDDPELIREFIAQAVITYTTKFLVDF